MKTLLLITAFAASPIFAQSAESNSNEKPPIDYLRFSNKVAEIQTYRSQRLVKLATFLEYAKDSNTIILDTRSKKSFDEIHIKGAKHLNFSDFTKKSLAKAIPDKNTRILIYCNNNFFSAQPLQALESKFAPLALNIPTFINLHGYGYTNIYELGSHHPVNPKIVPLEGSRVKDNKVIFDPMARLQK